MSKLDEKYNRALSAVFIHLSNFVTYDITGHSNMFLRYTFKSNDYCFEKKYIYFHSLLN